MLATNGVNEASIVHINGGARQIATLQVLYHQEPDPARNVPYIEVRQWVTVAEDGFDLIAEWGHVNEEDDLVTECAVLPGYYGLAQALTFVNERLQGTGRHANPATVEQVFYQMWTDDCPVLIDVVRWESADGGKAALVGNVYRKDASRPKWKAEVLPPEWTHAQVLQWVEGHNKAARYRAQAEPI